MYFKFVFIMVCFPQLINVKKIIFLNLGLPRPLWLIGFVKHFGIVNSIPLHKILT